MLDRAEIEVDMFSKKLVGIADIRFFRHGESNWNLEKRVQGASLSEKIVLSPAGRLSVKSTLIHTPKPHVLITSPALRCKQTGEEWLSSAWDKKMIPRRINEDILEIRAGKYEGLLIPTLSEDRLWQQWMTDPKGFVGFPGGENLTEFSHRVLRGVADICAEYGDSKLRVYVITHGVVMRVLKCVLLDQDLSHLWEHQVNNLEQIILSPEQIKKFPQIYSQLLSAAPKLTPGCA